jgi:hypothetical protein
MFGRSSFQRFSPVSTSRPQATPWLSLSICTTSVFPATTGDDAIPRLLPVCG